MPALRVGGKFYSISLRMMKSIWRNVRLHKDFVNVEHAPFGGVKLRIPMNLYAEKMRTASKFKVRLICARFLRWCELKGGARLFFGGVNSRVALAFDSCTDGRALASVRVNSRAQIHSYKN